MKLKNIKLLILISFPILIFLGIFIFVLIFNQDQKAKSKWHKVYFAGKITKMKEADKGKDYRIDDTWIRIITLSFEEYAQIGDSIIKVKDSKKIRVFRFSEDKSKMTERSFDYTRGGILNNLTNSDL